MRLMGVDPASFINVASMFNTNMRPNATSSYPGRSYRFYTGQFPYQFGDGLRFVLPAFFLHNSLTFFSYTTFSYRSSLSECLASLASVVQYTEMSYGEYLRDRAPVLQWVTVTVTNNGDVAGSDVVLLFVKNPTPGEGGAPLRTLAGFERVFLQPGESIEVPFSITAHDLTVTNLSGGRSAQYGSWTLEVGQPASLVIDVFVA